MGLDVTEILSKIWSGIVSIISLFFLNPPVKQGVDSDIRDLPQKSKPTVAVIGSGFSGLCAAIQVRDRLGIKPQVFEASEEVGGTWLANTYPGCACDVPSHLYSYSFELNPDWSHTYSPQAEILEYARFVAKKYGMYDHIMLNTEVIEATWLDDKRKWKLDYRHKKADGSFSDVKTAYFDVVFGALGPLRIANIPEQYKAFEGTIVHTTFWDKNISFKNKRVAIIGSGASAIQAIPELQKDASKLISYQRTPSWIVGRAQMAYLGWMKTIFRYFPIIMRIQRVILFFFHEAFFPIVFRNYNSASAKFARKLLAYDMVRRLKKQKRGDLAKILVPEYAVGCKRICRSENYLEALAQNNVLVKKGSIKEVKGHSIFHEDGSEEKVDILVLATGFDVQGFLGNLQINGKGGIRLNDQWRENYPATFQNVNINGFPNFFLLLGPNSGLGHNSIITIIEIQVEYALRSIKYMMKNNLAALEARKESQDNFVSTVLSQLKGSAWTGGCKSYYKNDKGELIALWSGTVSYYWYKMKSANYSQDFMQFVKS